MSRRGAALAERASRALREALDLPHPPWILGHRGAAGEALENTLPSLALGLAQGADLLELDLRLTADGVLVAFHDDDLARLAGRPEPVETLPASEVVGLGLVDRRSGLEGRIPSLNEILERLPGSPALNLELKASPAEPARIATALARQLGDHRRVLVSSFDWNLLEEVARAAPELPVAPLGSRSPRRLVAAARRLDAAAVHCHRRLARSRLTHTTAEDSRPLLVYTVNRASTARRLLGRGVAGLFTDHPGRLRQRLGGS